MNDTLDQDHGGIAPELEDRCERCEGSGVDPAGATPGASCQACEGTGVIFTDDPPDPL